MALSQRAKSQPKKRFSLIGSAHSNGCAAEDNPPGQDSTSVSTDPAMSKQPRKPGVLAVTSQLASAGVRVRCES